MKFKKNIIKIISAFVFIIPLSTFAYSQYVIPGGQTIGIEVNSKGVTIVGFYEVDGKYIAKEAGFKEKDIIIEVNNQKIKNIETMVNIIKNTKTDKINFKVLRNNKEKEVSLKIKLESLRSAVILGFFCLSEPAAAFLGFFAGCSPSFS